MNLIQKILTVIVALFALFSVATAGKPAAKAAAKPAPAKAQAKGGKGKKAQEEDDDD